MIPRRLLAIAVLPLVSGWAHACLFAMNPNSDAMLVPLSASYADHLRAHKSKQR